MNDRAPAAASTGGVLFRGDGYTAEAGWFGPEDRPRFGWLYRPDTPAPNGAGVVIVPPFGREDICAHRTLRHLAEDAAKAGFIAARFDLDGTGDSAGNDADPDRMGAWTTSISDACDLMRGSGASQLVLIGVRLGATLATLAAQGREDVSALIAFNAVVSGRTYLRELRALQNAMNLAPPPSESPPQPAKETSGFLLTDDTCATLQAIDLAKIAVSPAPIVHVLERDDLPERKGLPTHLQALGAHVTVDRLPGYAEMMNDPHSSRVAQAFIDACIDHVRELHATPGGPRVPGESLSLRPSSRLRIGNTLITEEVVAPGAGMFGILAAPAAIHADRVVLMLNAGAVRRIGSNRIDVGLARQLAAMDRQVLRVDLPGIGDSPAHAGEPENVVYGPCCVDDVGVAVSWIRARCAGELAVGGMCSGAYHALRAAIAGQDIERVYLINCLVFGPTVKFDPESTSLLGDVTHYNEAVRSGHAWRRLLTGRASFRTVARVAAWHLGNHFKRLGLGLARHLRIPLRNDLGGALVELARRRVHVHFLFSANESGQTLLAAEAGSVVPRLSATGMMDTQVFDGADHTFTQRWAQAMLHDALVGVLAAPTSRIDEAPPP